MSRTISMFSATADIEGALTALACTALGLPRDTRRIPLAECPDLLASAQGHARILSLAERMGIPAGQLPSREALERMFDDELLSMKALKLHHGRNVYSAGKLALWNALWLPFRDRLTPDDATLALLAELVALRTTRGSDDLDPCARLLEARLVGIGFDVNRIARDGNAPILVARRPARGLAGCIVLYGHYDAAATPRDAWTSDPWTLDERDGRLFGCAVGDNKAPLALRFTALSRMERAPELVWILQGEEECDSPLAHDAFPDVMRDLRATLWLEENGYHDLDGTLRVLARVMGPTGTSEAPDATLDAMIDAVAHDAAAWGLRHRVEVRGLNKDFSARGCPFNRNLPTGARYLALGVNDPASRIHRPDESVPTWTFALHARQLETVFNEVDRIARGTA